MMYRRCEFLVTALAAGVISPWAPTALGQPQAPDEAGAPAAAAESEAEDALELEEAEQRHELGESVITATRTPTPVGQLTRSVTAIDRETIEQQSVISRDLGDILGKTVPGFATSTEGSTNYTQTLRGRSYLVMVDGVPISLPLRDGARDLKVIDPEALGQVEVLRGGSAVYGFGAAGGLVNLITRDPEEEGFGGFVETGLSFSTTHPDGSLQWHTSLGAWGKRGEVDYLLLGSTGERNRFFDSDGDRIPPDPLLTQGGLADTQEWNVLGKLGVDFAQETQRFEITFNNYDSEQDTDFVTRPGDISAGEKAVGVPGDPRGNNPATELELISLTWEHRDALGSHVKVQGYHLDYLARFGIAPAAFGAAQAEDVSEKIGARLTIDTPLGDGEYGPRLIWGADYQNERTAELVYGANTFGVASIPEMDQDALAGFAELDLPVGEIGRVRAGVRHESFWLDVPTFSNPSGTATMQGGELDYDETLYNATAVVYLNEEMELFGGFSQGFAPSEVGRVLQDQVSYFGGGSVEAIRPEAQTVDNYELGLRGDWGRLRGSVAGFFSESDLGTTFDNATLQVIRQPEEIWGIESGVEYDIHEQWTLGGTATWIESRTDADGDGDLDEELPSTRVPPIKLTGFVEYRPTHWWNNRLQVLFSGDREPDTTVFGSAEVDSFTIVDYFAGFDAGPGELRVGVENLLNEDYYPVAAQAFGMDSTFSQGEGRTVSLSYRIDW